MSAVGSTSDDGAHSNAETIAPLATTHANARPSRRMSSRSPISPMGTTIQSLIARPAARNAPATTAAVRDTGRGVGGATRTIAVSAHRVRNGSSRSVLSLRSTETDVA